MRQSRNVQITELSASGFFQYAVFVGNRTKHYFSIFSVNFMSWQLIFKFFPLKMYNKTIINVSVRVICLAFGSTDNLYHDIDNSAYHKTFIQELFNIEK